MRLCADMEACAPPQRADLHNQRASLCLAALERGDSTSGGGRREWRPLTGDQEPDFFGGEADFLGLSRFLAAAAAAGDRGGRCSDCLQPGCIFMYSITGHARSHVSRSEVYGKHE